MTHKQQVNAGDEIRWTSLVDQIGREAAAPLTAALERVDELADTGRIDSASLRALRAEVEHARRVAILGQQLARLAGGVRQQHESMNLTFTLHSLLRERGRDLEPRGISLHQVLRPAEVRADPPLMTTLLNAVIDWALTHARSTIDFRLDHSTWPGHPRLACHFQHCPPDEAGGATPALESLPWWMTEQAAAAMGLALQREDDDCATTLTLEFMPPAESATDGATRAAPTPRPLADRHVLAVCARRVVRMKVVEAMRGGGALIDFVAGIDDARRFCADTRPDVVVYESALGGERFDDWRGELGGTPFVELAEDGDRLELSGFGGPHVTRIGRDAIIGSLAQALVFELAH